MSLLGHGPIASGAIATGAVAAGGGGGTTDLGTASLNDIVSIVTANLTAGARNLVYGADGADAKSAAGVSTLSVAMPAGLTSGQLLIIVAQMKPSVANAGDIATPAGWTAGPSSGWGGGYGSTLGVNTGNTKLFTFFKTAGASEPSVTLSLTNNSVTYASTFSFTGVEPFSVIGVAGDLTAAPASGAYSDTFSLPGHAAAGDEFLFAMGFATENAFTAGNQSFTETGLTFGVITERDFPFISVGNKLAASVATGHVATGSVQSYTSCTVAVTTSTDADTRGPTLLLRLRERTVQDSVDIDARSSVTGALTTAITPTAALSGASTITATLSDCHPAGIGLGGQQRDHRHANERHAPVLRGQGCLLCGDWVQHHHDDGARRSGGRRLAGVLRGVRGFGRGPHALRAGLR
jgi:hypothetical protein